MLAATFNITVLIILLAKVSARFEYREDVVMATVLNSSLPKGAISGYEVINPNVEVRYLLSRRVEERGLHFEVDPSWTPDVIDPEINTKCQSKPGISITNFYGPADEVQCYTGFSVDIRNVPLRETQTTENNPMEEIRFTAHYSSNDDFTNIEVYIFKPAETSSDEEHAKVNGVQITPLTLENLQGIREAESYRDKPWVSAEIVTRAYLIRTTREDTLNFGGYTDWIIGPPLVMDAESVDEVAFLIESLEKINEAI